MKIRIGFVSNSSSSSFCLFGVFVGDSNKSYDEACKLVEGNELCVENACDECDNSVYVGLPPEKMKEDETLREFRERIKSQLAKNGLDCKDEEISWITDGGYNG